MKQISEKQIDLLVERLTSRIEKANEIILKAMGSKLDEMGKLTSTDAHKLVQMLKYGDSYDKIIKQLDKYTNMNLKDVDKIFNEFAKKDKSFYKQFYEYRNIPFDTNKELIDAQVTALRNMFKNSMYDYTRSNILGYTLKNPVTNKQTFYTIKETYNRLLDTALMNVGQGKQTFDSAMSDILRDIGDSGIKTIDYASGKSTRLDSVVRMHLKDSLLQLHDENQKIYGEDFDADGYEISVHENPAIDHELVQGHQFDIPNYELLNNGGIAKDVKGNEYTLDHDAKNGYRPISTMNCYHYIFPIIIGVSEPEYTDEQLESILKDNRAGFELDGKHYTNYEGTQLQRSLERRIREQKDIQILAKASDNKELIAESQTKITQLTNKYKELSNVSGLPTYMERMKVSGYKRVKVTK